MLVKGGNNFPEEQSEKFIFFLKKFVRLVKLMSI